MPFKEDAGKREKVKELEGSKGCFIVRDTKSFVCVIYQRNERFSMRDCFLSVNTYTSKIHGNAQQNGLKLKLKTLILEVRFIYIYTHTYIQKQ